MTLTTDFRTVTDRIQAARRSLDEAEQDRLMARHDLAVAEDALETERRRLMASPDAGTNDTARRVYAAYHTQAMLAEVRTLSTDVVYAERDVIGAATALRIAEDERRYLEFVAKLAVTGEPYNAFAHVNGSANGHSEEEFSF
jgi:hypothetical protein